MTGRKKKSMDKNIYIFRMAHPNASKLGSLLEQAWSYKMLYIYMCVYIKFYFFTKMVFCF